MKKLLIALTGMLMVVSLVACGSDKKEETTPVEDQTVETEGTETENTESENVEADAETFTFEGVVEEKRDLTIIVKANEGDDAYIFNLPEDFETEAVEGSKVKVTYTGNKDDIDAQLNAVSIEIVD